MRYTGRGVEIVSEQGVKDIVDFALQVLSEVGMRIENTKLCEHLAENGAEWDGEFGIKFPQKLISEFLSEQRTKPGEIPAEGRPIRFSGSAGGYPLRWVDPKDGEVKTQTAQSTCDLIRLADYLPGIDGIGSIGVPQDVPPVLQPLAMRFLNWRYAGSTLANIYVIWDTRLCPYILEFCQTVSEMESHKGGMERWLRAHNYLVSPLKFAKGEAEQFQWFWERGYRCDVGNLMSMGGTAPATVAGACGMSVAELIALSFIHHVFYGDKGFNVVSKVAPLDMRSGYMPYGRPEEMLIIMISGQVAEYLGASDAPSLGTATGAKGTDFECGLNKGFAAGLSMGALGAVSWSFGKYSTDEVIDPRMMVIEDEFIQGLRRLAENVEVNKSTLPIDVAKEVGPGGAFLSHLHTFEHFRKEMWLPTFFSGEAYEAWVVSGKMNVLEKARKKVIEILDTYHPRGIKETTEEKLLGIIGKCAKELGVEKYDGIKCKG